MPAMEYREKFKKKYHDGRGDGIELQMFVANRIEKQENWENWKNINLVIDEIGKDCTCEAKIRPEIKRKSDPEEEATKQKIEGILEQLWNDVEILQDDKNHFELSAFEEISNVTKQHYDAVKVIDVKKNEDLREKKIEAYKLITTVNKLITSREARSKFVKIY